MINFNLFERYYNEAKHFQFVAVLINIWTIISNVGILLQKIGGVGDTALLYLIQSRLLVLATDKDATLLTY